MAQAAARRHPLFSGPFKLAKTTLSNVMIKALVSAEDVSASPVQAHAARLLPAAQILKPQGPGPFPVVLQMHGCGGCKPFQRTYAESLAEAGVAAVVIDSFAPRGISTVQAYATVCTGLRLWGAQRAADLFALYAWVRAQPWADPSRILAAGWSHGGWTVMDALALPRDRLAAATGLADLAAEPLEGLAGAFLVYPYCGAASLTARHGWRFTPKTTAIVAGRDSVVGARRPLAVLEGIQSRGAEMDVRLFPEATHAFDEPGAKDVRMSFSPERAAQTRALLIELALSTQDLRAKDLRP